jgi:hypothetical protein
VGESAVLDNNVRITHIALGSMAVEYPGSPVFFTTQTVAPTAAPTVAPSPNALQTTKPGTKTYMCTKVTLSCRCMCAFFF